MQPHEGRQDATVPGFRAEKAGLGKAGAQHAPEEGVFTKPMPRGGSLSSGPKARSNLHQFDQAGSRVAGQSRNSDPNDRRNSGPEGWVALCHQQLGPTGALYP